MNVEFSKAFDKQTAGIKDKNLNAKIGKVIKQVIGCKSLNEVPNLIAITNNPGYYRIRIGNYRIGIWKDDETIWFLFFGKRDENTYKKFP